jgi:hypothetical protein
MGSKACAAAVGVPVLALFLLSHVTAVCKAVELTQRCIKVRSLLLPGFLDPYKSVLLNHCGWFRRSAL